ncbi:MAG: DUF4294 domain-containing protein [Lentimicrobiaceae bacterium]|nr:DUF4294 domain-containing protein [Lentimicrobiaceae bacterium]
MKRIILIALAIVLITKGFAQDKIYVLPVCIEGTDTIPYIVLPVYIHVGAKNKREAERFSRLLYNVRKVYPYARFSAEKLQEYDDMLAKIPNVDERKKVMKEAEKQLRKQFQKDIENLTFSQGIILLKLVDRETGKTTYKIVDELRGSLRAFFYQSIARLFGMNLKSQYDPKGKDKDIERIVRMIELGEL